MKTYNDFVVSRVIPAPSGIECSDNRMFRLADRCAFSLHTPVAEKEATGTVLELCRMYWNIAPVVSFHSEACDTGAEGYRLKVTEKKCAIFASDLNGIRNALKTMRQLCESERGVLTSSCRFLPSVAIEDRPALAFRGIHFCWFPETTIWEIEKNIRLAAYYKFNYAVIESWGMIRLDSHPEYCWDEFAVDKKEVARLVRLAADQGLTLIPQLNLFGHATSSRCGSGKHMLLDRHPEYAPLFEPDGWTWCISNPCTRRYLTEIAAEIHELFGNPKYFHIGCDEAYNAGSCSLCGENYPEKLKEHLLYFHDWFAVRGARVMMWHDMLLNSDDPRWNGYIVCGGKRFAELYRELPKDIIICDWQYGYPKKEEREPEWPTSRFFHREGFDVLVCPWLDREGTASLGALAKEEKLFGMLETTWHKYRTSHALDALFIHAANASWHPGWKPEKIVYREYLNCHLREIAQDMKLNQYIQFGSVQYQIDITPFQD